MSLQREQEYVLDFLTREEQDTITFNIVKDLVDNLQGEENEYIVFYDMVNKTLEYEVSSSEEIDKEIITEKAEKENKIYIGTIGTLMNFNSEEWPDIREVVEFSSSSNSNDEEDSSTQKKCYEIDDGLDNFDVVKYKGKVKRHYIYSSIGDSEYLKNYLVKRAIRENWYEVMFFKIDKEYTNRLKASDYNLYNEKVREKYNVVLE